jgi:hypothetical protein
MLRSKLSSGEYKYLNDFPKSMRETLDSSTFALYKVSNELGTLNLAAHGTNAFDDKPDFLLDHGF